MYDIIGDIHGHACALEQLLQKLGYESRMGYYSHPERKVIFVGDYIDRGPKIRETLSIVKAMVDHEQAIALMGNHEFNAILFNTKKASGSYLRERNEKNTHQHIETLNQFKGYEKEYNEYIAWFKTLPLFYEDQSIRVVHACWDSDYIQFLQETLTNKKLTDKLLLEQYEKGSSLYNAIETTLKGKELNMPEGLIFLDKDGHRRSELRVKWWLNPEGVTYRNYSIEHLESLPNDVVPAALVQANKPYLISEKPVFFGHYWLSGDAALSMYGENICCVDYSIAKKGKLVAYRWKGEQCLNQSNMIHVTPDIHS